MELTRDEIVEKLVVNNINTITHSYIQHGDDTYLTNILEYGMVGFKNFTDEELVNEYRETFDEVVKIKK
jgi:hypothetical protein